MSDPNLVETSRVIEIKDNFGTKRFKVALADFDSTPTRDVGFPFPNDLRYQGMKYQVTVTSYCYSVDPVVIVDELFPSFEKAEAYFKTMLKLYVGITKMETRNYQDINIYADKIGYKIIDNNRCENCRWVKREPGSQYAQHKHGGCKAKCHCTNERIFTEEDIEKTFQELLDELDCELRPNMIRILTNGSPKLPKTKNEFLPIHPEVDADGICNYYERFNPENIPLTH